MPPASLTTDPADAVIPPRTRIFSAVAGLLSASAAAFLFCRTPARTLTLSELLGVAAGNLLFVYIAFVIAALGYCALRPPVSRPAMRRLLAQTSLTALWLAPLVLFVRERSLLTVVLAALFAVFASASIRMLQDPADAGPEEPIIQSLRSESALLAFKAGPRTSKGASFALQIGLLAALAGYMFSAAGLVALAFALWTWSYTRNAPAPVSQYSRSPSRARQLSVVALVAFFTLTALSPFLRRSIGIGHFGSFPGHHRGYPAFAGDRTSGERGPVAHSFGEPGDSGEMGIVLWPDNQVITKLVAPIPVSLTARATGHNSDPLIIPFNGVYWVFKTPDVQPPKNSRQVHASPEAVNIRSTDRRPLSIEAHDHLGKLIDLSCCSRIEISIRNADRYPETVSLELVLINTSLPGRPSESLGRNTVKSTRPWNIYEKPSPVSETLNFAIPRASSLRRFDEMKIVFRLDRARADSGAKIAIDHFVLIPRAL